MAKILVGYVTHSGTTQEVAEAVAEELTKAGLAADLLPLAEVRSLEGYSAALIGAPMIVGWHREARKFLAAHKNELSAMPLALFMTGMSLTQTPPPDLPGIQLHIDPKLPSAPKKAGHLSFKENFASLRNYLRPILKLTPASLKALAFFGGRLDFYRLKWYEAAFVILVVGANPGEKRNWADIRAWAAGMPNVLKAG